jgi:hypothetical protein
MPARFLGGQANQAMCSLQIETAGVAISLRSRRHRRRWIAETELTPGELITAVELPPMPMARHSTYRKVRDCASFAFALVSVAAALEVGADGSVRDVRLALGGVAPKPWRAHAAEMALRGAPAIEAAFRMAAEAELSAAQPLRHNGGDPGRSDPWRRPRTEEPAGLRLRPPRRVECVHHSGRIGLAHRRIATDRQFQLALPSSSQAPFRRSPLPGMHGPTSGRH